MPIFWQSGDRGKEAGGVRGGDGGGEVGGACGRSGNLRQGSGQPGGGGGSHGVNFVAEPRGVLTAAAGGITLLTIGPICFPFFFFSYSHSS